MSSKSWFDHAFPSRAKTEELLRPDLQSGLLTPHDYELAVSFFPGPVRRLPYVHMAVAGVLSGLAVYRFKGRIRFPTAAISGATIIGYGTGLVHYFREQKKFVDQLEDRQAFFIVLDNVNHRLGSATSLLQPNEREKLLERIKQRREQSGEVIDTGVEFVTDFSDSTGSTDPTDRPAPSVHVSQESPGRQRGAWDAIREANARNAGRQSSWDALRERYERQRTAGRVQQKESTEIEDPRAQAQAEFDAILEAERKAARAS
ncbi:hypothetical protein BD413DRAFT_601313 [Trametes elegans]|nr:hypothetical protein BD413DRAFT_601313 [Trametes elegans]